MIVDNDTNSSLEANTFIMNNNSGNGGGVVKFGLGIFPTSIAKLPVAGNAKLTEELHLGNMTTTERDALTAVHGMIHTTQLITNSKAMKMVLFKNQYNITLG